jgi:hypothetical protein
VWKPRRWPGLNAPGFDASFERQLQAGVKDAAFVYAGDLAEGEAYEGQLTQIEQVGDWSIVGLSDRRVSLIVDATIKVSVELQYEDRDSASWGTVREPAFPPHSVLADCPARPQRELPRRDPKTGRGGVMKGLARRTAVSRNESQTARWRRVLRLARQKTECF